MSHGRGTYNAPRPHGRELLVTASVIAVARVIAAADIRDVVGVKHAAAIPRASQVDGIPLTEAAEARIVTAHDNCHETARDVVAHHERAAAIVDSFDNAMQVARGRVRTDVINIVVAGRVPVTAEADGEPDTDGETRPTIGADEEWIPCAA